MTTVNIDIVKTICAKIPYYHRDSNKMMSGIVRRTLSRVDSIVTRYDDIKSYFIGEDGIMAAVIFRMKQPNKIKQLHRYRMNSNQ